jgi:hypothetical protein
MVKPVENCEERFIISLLALERFHQSVLDREPVTALTQGDAVDRRSTTLDTIRPFY